MDIDLDAIFGGQCATDLDDYEDIDTTTTEPTNTIDLNSYFDGQSATDLDDEDDDTTTANIDATIVQPIYISAHHYYPHAHKVVMRDGLDGDSIINAPGYQPPKHSQWKRDEANKLVIWDGIKVARPVYRPSPLRQVESTAIEVPMTSPTDTTTDDLSSSSASSSDADTPPSSPELPWTPIVACPQLSLLSPPIDTIPLEDSATKSSDRRSGMYAAIVIGISVVLSLW